MKIFDHRLMNDVYYPFHTQDPEWAIRSLLEIKNLDEDFLDKNKRLKKILKNRYENDPEFQKIIEAANKENNIQNKEEKSNKSSLNWKINIR